MKLSPGLLRALAVAVAIAVVAAIVSACGGGSSTTKTGGTSATTKQTGVGLSTPTTGSGARIKGGTVTFAEAPGSPPNYIFPMRSTQYCGLSNVGELSQLLYRPLYWFGNNNSPTINYNDSVGQKPVFSNGGKTVTIHLNNYKWSDGESMSARDVVFWINLLKADPAKEWCEYAVGRFPDNLTGYKAVNSTTVQLTFNRAYNPTWLIYNQLSQITPLPMAWDRTSLSQKAPSPDAANLPDTTKAGANAVFSFLNTQSQKIGTWGSSPLWGVVDGPWRLQSTTTNGGVTFVPNKDYTGPSKPILAKFVEVPFTSEEALVNQIKSQGTNGLNIAYIPSQYQPLTSSFESQGYDVNMGSTYQFYFMVMNYHNPTVGPIVQQLYFRQALQHLIDQNGWITHFLHGAASPTYGPVPQTPSSTLASPSRGGNPFPFSTQAAAKLLTQNGWKVVPNGQTYCQKPGTASGECGKGITRGQKITFNLDYESDVTFIEEEMQDLQSQAKKVGITIDLTSHPYDTVISSLARCQSSEPACRWTAENYGGGWLWGYYPSGEVIFDSTSPSNVESYDSPEMDKLIERTTTAPQSQEKAAMAKYVQYTETHLPLVFVPAAVGDFGFPTAGTLLDKHLGGFTVNTFGAITPEDWYLTK